jgi:hypothetical protein
MHPCVRDCTHPCVWERRHPCLRLASIPARLLARILRCTVDLRHPCLWDRGHPCPHSALRYFAHASLHLGPRASLPAVSEHPCSHLQSFSSVPQIVNLRSSPSLPGRGLGAYRLFNLHFSISNFQYLRASLSQGGWGVLLVEVLRVLFPVKKDVSGNPIAICLLSPQTEVAKPSYIAHLIEQSSFSHS